MSDVDVIEENKKKRGFPLAFYILIALLIGIYFNDIIGPKKEIKMIPYSEFLNSVKKGEVSEVTISDTKIKGTYKKDSSDKNLGFETVPVTDEQLIPTLQKNNIKFQSEAKSPFWSSVFWTLLPLVGLYFIWTHLFRKMAGVSQSPVLGLTKSKARVFVEKDISTTFSDVAGVDEAKEELEEVVSFLKDPSRYQQLGGRAPRGILLVGPPGTGKTLLARALAGESKVPFFSINGSEFVEMFVGLGAARVRELFQTARQQAPCIVFIDEVDAMGKTRASGLGGMGSNEEKEQTLHQLLAEMDGFDSTSGVIILAATNRPEILDPALLRAGRFDRQILVGLPDQVGRLQVLKVHINKIKIDPSVNLEKIAALTSGFSGADLANLVNEAALFAVRRNAKTVSDHDFTLAIERIVAGLEHKKRIMNPKEKKRIAYHELGHATVSLALDHSDKIHKVSIIPRGIGALGYTMQRPTEDRYLVETSELETKIAILLGGRASEEIFFSTVSTGAADDLIKATDIARSMVTYYSMSEKLGLQSFENKRPAFIPNEVSGYQPNNYSEKTAQIIDEEIKRILQKAFLTASNTIKKHKNFIESAVSQLIEHETLDEKKLNQIWDESLQRSLESEIIPASDIYDLNYKSSESTHH